MVNSPVISHRKLRERLGGLVTGPVLGAGDPAYEESRRVFNAMIERRIFVDPGRGQAVAEAGLTLGDFDAATSRYGLATTLGVVSMTGIAGLTLGGGIGWLNGKHGLACDNVLSMDVVTASSWTNVPADRR